MHKKGLSKDLKRAILFVLGLLIAFLIVNTVGDAIMDVVSGITDTIKKIFVLG